MKEIVKGKVAIVTGGSQGIGRAIAKRMAEQGATVIVTYLRNKEEAVKTVETINDEFPSACTAIHLDVREYDHVEEVFNQVRKKHGSIDVLINNAAVSAERALAINSLDNWGEILSTNIMGTINCIKAVSLPMLMARKGSIVSISSIAGIKGIPKLSSYSASKAGIIGLTRSLSKEFANFNVRINVVAPGYIEGTRMFNEIEEKDLIEYKEQIDLKRFGQPEEIAKAVGFICSDDASYITGQTLVVDGGLSI
ncbi:SDR family NAD(P)-dependent oxidoreductase [Rossellomorea marisflavi]|uniref:SDR family NAD(P)-dependent oxidoreductase n=1 Tax=Rossellomorea marisflavi TaxID=189381 RepID=UPI000A8241FD|nr:3-oxoacyl-ACP reductase FabG [Rossellomorea marisflavi]MDW4525520.1 3-oxoacyl-ACP reductase FabG [Rossellomorea marisflavi]USK93136.1 3-oxoacyl-ACP reductase FabG [Rossellomorea marisflavi]WJV18039.1 3-oxoacyl-ACP reductase FabG [Rossellomorea marisflavi]